MLAHFGTIFGAQVLRQSFDRCRNWPAGVWNLIKRGLWESSSSPFGATSAHPKARKGRDAAHVAFRNEGRACSRSASRLATPAESPKPDPVRIWWASVPKALQIALGPKCTQSGTTSEDIRWPGARRIWPNLGRSRPSLDGARPQWPICAGVEEGIDTSCGKVR